MYKSIVKETQNNLMKTQKNKYKGSKGITLVALVITIVLNCWRSGRYHIEEINLMNILEKGINLL